MAAVPRPPSDSADVDGSAQSEHAVRRRRVAAVAFVLAALVTLAGPAAADPPTLLSAPPDITVEAVGPTGAPVSFDLSSLASDDNGVPGIVCSPASGTLFAIGSTPVLCMLTDKLTSEATSASFNVIVRDTTPPVITVPAPITAEATSSNGAPVSFVVAATDSVDPAPAVTCTPASGSSFPVGKTSVSCTARDASGNTSAAQGFTVTVQDTTPPTITVPAPITATATGPSGATVSFTVTATDLVDGAVSVACTPVSGSTFALGETTVSCSAHDAANNAASASFTVTVQDTTPPVITVPALDHGLGDRPERRGRDVHRVGRRPRRRRCRGCVYAGLRLDVPAGTRRRSAVPLTMPPTTPPAAASPSPFRTRRRR